ncbi:hypothetical protein CRG98_044667, partial [Punica granatum]
KKLKKFQASDQTGTAHHDQLVQRSTLGDQRRGLAGDITSSSSSSTYASSTENISRLLEGWMRSSPKNSTNTTTAFATTNSGNYNLKNLELEKDSSIENATASLSCYHPKVEQEEVFCGDRLIPHDEFESILSFENLNANVSWDKSSTCDQKVAIGRLRSDHPQQQQASPPPPLSFLEKWLFDETTNGGQVEEIMELPSIF